MRPCHRVTSSEIPPSSKANAVLTFMVGSPDHRALEGKTIHTPAHQHANTYTDHESRGDQWCKAENGVGARFRHGSRAARKPSMR